MRSVRLLSFFSLSLLTTIMLAGCDKEKIVNSSQIVRDTQYVQLPPDTVFVTDTVFNNSADTVRIIDTVNTPIIVHDTIVTVQHHYDTLHVTDTIVTVQHHYDTVVTVQHHYDTITTVQHHYDTVTVAQCQPSSVTAASAMARKTDPLVFEMIESEFGISGGWVFYVSHDQMEISQVSSKVYDIYAYVDYWTDDWEGYYPLEAFWRLTYTSGDPSNPGSWQMSDPPTSAHRPQVHLINASNQIQTNTR